MKPQYSDDTVTLHHGDCLDVLRDLDDASVDAVVTDPPYGLGNTTPEQVAETVRRWMNGERDYLPGGAGFMGKAWDAFVPPVAVWDEALRVLKPGGHLLAFSGSRTFDLMSLSIRLAGFETRDSIAWLYGSGFPKSLDVSKAIDKACGAERKVVTEGASGAGTTTISALGDGLNVNFAPRPVTAPATPEAERWQGWGTALKPAFEPIVVARKPLEGTVASNVLRFGTGALNIDGCRVDSGSDYHDLKVTQGGKDGGGFDVGSSDGTRHTTFTPATGRWPANVVLDESQAEVLDEQSGVLKSGANPEIRGGDTDKREVYGGFTGGRNEQSRRGTDEGGASRFFYVAKADASERVRVDGIAHPTVKPLDLMRWLVRLVTPPGGTVLEPFAGSGTTVEACLLEGFRCVAIEREADYLPLIESRIARRRDPVRAVELAGGDAGLFGLLEGA